MPSRPSLQAWAKTVGPSPSICSLNRMPELALATIDASVALRTSSGSRRRSSPFSSIRSKACGNVGVVGAVGTDEIECVNPVLIAGNSLAVDDASRGAASPTFTALTLDGQAIISPDCVPLGLTKNEKQFSGAHYRHTAGVSERAYVEPNC